jgi:hypothetical protein
MRRGDLLLTNFLIANYDHFTLGSGQKSLKMTAAGLPQRLQGG